MNQNQFNKSHIGGKVMTYNVLLKEFKCIGTLNGWFRYHSYGKVWIDEEALDCKVDSFIDPCGKSKRINYIYIIKKSKRLLNVDKFKPMCIDAKIIDNRREYDL